MKKYFFLLFFLLAVAASYADSMAVFVNGDNGSLRPSATNAVLTAAKTYTDTSIAAIPSAHDYSPDIATASNAVLTAAKDYSDDNRDYAKVYSNTNTLVRAKDYADSAASSKLPISGGTMTGNISMGSKKITNLATPTSDADASTKKYVDDAKSGAISTLKTWARGATNAVLISARTFATSEALDKAGAAQTAAAADATTKANNAKSFAKTYSDTNTLVRAKAYADTKKSEAISAASSDATSKANTAESNAISSAKTWGRSATNAVLTAAKTFASSEASAAQFAAVSAAASDATTKVNNLKTEAYDWAKNLKIKMGTGTDAPKTAGNSTAYTLAATRDKIALTNVASGASLQLLVDVVYPDATPVYATVKAGNARYCTVNFDVDDAVRTAGATVNFHLLVTAINTANSASPAVTKSFYITHKFQVQ